MDTLRTLAAVALILAGATAMVRRVDVRLALALCAAALFALAGEFYRFFGFAARELTNEKTVVPICSAMGFAYVLRLTGCDRDLVRLLLAPLRRVRALLVPGGVAVAFLVNTAIVSQSSTAASVGPVLIPLLVGSGFSTLTAGSVLLLGSSMGGELFNPGAVEIVTIDSRSPLNVDQVVAAVMPFNLVASAVALVVFWLMEARGHSPIFPIASPAADPPTPKTEHWGLDTESPANPLKALVPFVPLALLFILPNLPQLAWLPKKFHLDGREFDTNSVLILAAMLAGVAAATLTSPRLVGKVAGAFFEGAGFAYANIISLIVTATLFTEGIKANDLIDRMAAAMSGQPVAAMAASVLLPGILAVATGSGIAPGVAVITALMPEAARMGLNPLHLGALTAVAAQLGRTMSPVAAVVIMSASLSGRSPFELVRRVMVPLLAAAGALLLFGIARTLVLGR